MHKLGSMRLHLIKECIYFVREVASKCVKLCPRIQDEREEGQYRRALQVSKAEFVAFQ